MMGKIPKPGKSFAGCVRYNVQKKDAEILYADGVRADQVNHTIADFNMQRKLNPDLGNAVGHIALSWSPNDAGKLNNDLMINIANEYLYKMKILDTQVLMVRHKDRDHPHLHIVYNRVNNQGQTISDKFQWKLNIKVAKALTLKHDMYLSKGKEQVNRQQLKGIDKVKYELYDAIKIASQKVNNMDELQQQLQKQGIGMLYKYKSGSREIQGVSFGKDDYKFKGSEIDRSLSYGKLSHSIEQRAIQQQEQKLRQRQFVGQLRGAVRSYHQGEAMSKGPTFHRDNNSILSILLEPQFSVQVSTDEDAYRRKKRKKGKGPGHDQDYRISR
ncbi:relaxase/mobilization nuclease domain-containing protein [Mucilaginibacter sp. SJ]|uniref:relaxase/mobilization nuclease domain-containing protein n=1 Tax=Mucilaginibacter sp. SJ TaxID=3029053 RepID=UPI0023A9B760|nr:relaxase/mobilization nuclease domain-containing protein [Mucilaginibacter sp. SJ]WEA01673.1 relaxase/mobilization nuclease domain-containing protein [Mucilaginibacter sp. SJ]